MRRKQNIFLYAALSCIMLILIIVNHYCFSKNEIMSDILIGLFSSLILILFLEIRDFKKDKNDFGSLHGNYKREARYHENKDAEITTKWNIVTSNDNPNLRLIYKGGREYHIPEIHYDEEWTAAATIFLDETNRKYGEGIYQYTKKHESIKVDLGAYQLFVDELDNRRLYVFHQNYLPSGLSIGYEIWVRQ